MSTAAIKLAQARAAAEVAAANAANAQAAVAAGAAAASAAAQQQQPHAGVIGQPGDMAQLIAQLIAQQGQQAAAALSQQGLQAAASLAQQESARLGAEAARAEAAMQAAESLAQQRRAGAGPAPLFHGLARDIAVHQWLTALERWFESAHVAANADRIEVAAAAMRGTAQTWCARVMAADAAAVAAGTAPELDTWAKFAAAARKDFLPQAPERWALQQLETLIASGVKDVATYTNKFAELDMLTSADQLSRVMAYQRGLPESYRVKCAERQHTTLAAAMETTLALWNARAAAQTQSFRPAARVSNAEDTEESDEVAQSSDRVSRLEHRMDAFLTAMQSFRGGFNRGGRGGGNGGPSRGRGRQQQREGARPPRARTPEVSEAQAKERLAARVCIKCARPNHFARECMNETRKEDGLPTN
jgi:hypothetical protein